MGEYGMAVRTQRINSIKPFFARALSEVNVSTRSLLSHRLAIKRRRVGGVLKDLAIHARRRMREWLHLIHN